MMTASGWSTWAGAVSGPDASRLFERRGFGGDPWSRDFLFLGGDAALREGTVKGISEKIALSFCRQNICYRT